MTDSSDSDNSEVRRSVQLMAKLEQEGNPGSIQRESAEAEPQSRPSVPMERIPDEEWAKMSKTQRKHFLRKRRETRGEATRAPKDSSRPEGGGKRPRDVAGFTPSPNKEERKKPKIEAPSYSLITGCTKVAIISKEHPAQVLTSDYSEKLIVKLVGLMRENNPEERLISFCGYSYRSGAVVVNCVDEGSKDWLIQSIAKLATWEGVSLKTCDPKILEGYKKVSMFIPKPIGKMEEIMQNLKAQNGLDTDRWKVLPFGTKEHQHGLYVVASIPESHHKKICERNSRISHGFHVVEIKEIQGKVSEKRGESSQTKEEGEKEMEGTGVVDSEMAEARETEAATEPMTEASAGPNQPGAELKVKDRTQSLGGEGGPVSGGVGRDTAPGASARGRAAGGDRDSKKVSVRPGRDPPPRT